MNTPEYVMSDERIKQYNDEITTKNSDIAFKGAFIVSILIFITLSFFGWNNVSSIICLFYILGSGFTVFFAERIFGAKMKQYAQLFCFAFLMLTIPQQWFFFGGFYGVGNLWCIFAGIFIMFGTNGKLRYILLAITTAEVLIIISVTYLFPNLVNNELPKQEQRVLCMVSILIVGTYVLYVGIKQKEIADAAAIRIAMMQDDLTAQNEELAAINDELVDMADKLRTANATQRHFTASMNHELRSPLNGIEGSLQIMLNSGTLDTENCEMVKNALVSSKAMLQTVNDLLDFSKLEEGKFEIIKRHFDLRDTLDNLLAIFTPQASAKGLSFQIRIPRSTRVSMYADNVRIQQVLTNLLSNAVKYTKSGTVVLYVSTSSYHLNFRVSDTGQGMTQEEIKYLFDPFTRFNLKENVRIQGTGLGMNIVANLLKEMRGSIDVTSEKNVGTTFSVSIPIMYYDKDITYATPRAESNSETEPHVLDGLRILSVDDMKINRNIIRGMLKQCKVEITDADSGNAAIAECCRHKFDLIIMDHMMPGMDGLEALDEIRAGSNNSATPVIMLTGNTGQDYRNLYHEHGAYDYLEKPVLYETLVETIKKACGR